MVYNLLLLLIYLIELLIVNIILYYLFKKKNLKSYALTPLYSILILSTTLVPFYLDILYGFIVNYFILLTIYTIHYLYFRDRLFLVIGFTYLILYFYTCIVPFIVSDCQYYSLTCIYTRKLSINLFEYIVFTTGLIIMIMLNTITVLYERFEYKLFHIISTIYCISHYLVLLKNIPRYFYIIATILTILFIYYNSEYIGCITYSEEENVEKIFDKYVSLNTPLVFIVLALSILYSTLWG
ncbi:MAG: hypothetical protein QXT29_04285 [Desulfurococcaceae archaeon]